MRRSPALFFLALALITASRALAQCTQVDLTSFFVPSYTGWQTASEIWTGPAGPGKSDQWYSYAANKYAHVKFNNPKSVETFTVNSFGIYLTAENGANNTTSSRTFPPGSQPGFLWMPRTGYYCRNCTVQELEACIDQNEFTPCHDGEDWFNQSCQLTTTYPAHCFINPSIVTVDYPYNYGYNIGTVTTTSLYQREDDGTAEVYYYGLGYGFLRWEQYNASGVLANWGAATQINLNQPIGDTACFHP